MGLRVILPVQLSLFDCLNPFTNISDYLNLWNIFRLSFRQLRMTSFDKIMVAEKNYFSSNVLHNFAKSNF